MFTAIENRAIKFGWGFFIYWRNFMLNDIFIWGAKLRQTRIDRINDEIRVPLHQLELMQGCHILAKLLFSKFNFPLCTQNLKPLNIYIQAALVICGLFICDFAYMWSRNDLFSGTYPLIIIHPWSFHIRIRVYFWSPYPSHITRSNCIYKCWPLKAINGSTVEAA